MEFVFFTILYSEIYRDEVEDFGHIALTWHWKFKLHLIECVIQVKECEMFSAWDTSRICRDSLSMTSSLGFTEDQRSA